MPFVAAGLAIGIATYRGRLEATVPQWVIGALCVVFVVAGLLMTASGLRDLARGRARARRLAETGAPWHADFAWDQAGATDRSGRPLASFGALLIVALLLVPFNYWAWASGKANLLFQVLVAIFDGVLLLGLGNAVYLSLRASRYGDARLRFEAFPFWLGEEVRVRFDPPRRLPACEAVRCTLRCVEEAYERQRKGRRIVCYALFQEERRETAENLARGLHLAFSIPRSGVPGTDLVSRPATYWELEVHIDTTGIDYLGRFLVPVYSREAPSANPS